MNSMKTTQRISVFRRFRNGWAWPLVALLIALFQSTPARGQMTDYSPASLQKIDVQEHLGESIPLDLTFNNHHGEEVTLGEYFNRDRPVLLTLAYYECPMLCTLVLNGIRNVADSVSWIPGEDYQIVTVSIDPRETPELARTKHEVYLKSLDKQVHDDSWVFLTGSGDQSRQLADALGFRYYYVEEKDIYAHPAVSYVLTESGRISRYLYGIDIQKRDLRLALAEGAEKKIGNPVEKVLLYCYQYSPDKEGYVLMAGNVMKLGGALTVVILGTVLGIFWYRERKRGQVDRQGNSGRV